MPDNGEHEKEREQENGAKEKEQGSGFEGEFDEARARRTIDTLRDEIKSLKSDLGTLRDAEKEREDAEKSEIEKMRDSLAAEQEKTKSAQRDLFVARAQAKHGLSDEDAEEFLSGLDDEEKILARAERIAGRLNPSKEQGSGEGEGDGDNAGSGIPGKPRPGLTPGQGGDDSAEIDEDALTASVQESRGY